MSYLPCVGVDVLFSVPICLVIHHPPKVLFYKGDIMSPYQLWGQTELYLYCKIIIRSLFGASLLSDSISCCYFNNFNDVILKDGVLCVWARLNVDKSCRKAIYG